MNIQICTDSRKEIKLEQKAQHNNSNSGAQCSALPIGFIKKLW